MALDATDLANDIKNDSLIMDDIPASAVTRIEAVWDRLAIHITEQIKRGAVTDVTVDLGSGNQNNSAPVV